MGLILQFGAFFFGRPSVSPKGPCNLENGMPLASSKQAKLQQRAGRSVHSTELKVQAMLGSQHLILNLARPRYAQCAREESKIGKKKREKEKNLRYRSTHPRVHRSIR